jgi:hypothetical protein
MVQRRRSIGDAPKYGDAASLNVNPGSCRDGRGFGSAGLRARSDDVVANGAVIQGRGTFRGDYDATARTRTLKIASGVHGVIRHEAMVHDEPASI